MLFCNGMNYAQIQQVSNGEQIEDIEWVYPSTGGQDSVYVSIAAIRASTIKMIERNSLIEINKQYKALIANLELEVNILKIEYINQSTERQRFTQLYLIEQEKLKKCKRQRNTAIVSAGVALAGLLLFAL